MRKGGGCAGVPAPRHAPRIRQVELAQRMQQAEDRLLSEAAARQRERAAVEELHRSQMEAGRDALAKVTEERDRLAETVEGLESSRYDAVMTLP